MTDPINSLESSDASSSRSLGLAKTLLSERLEGGDGVVEGAEGKRLTEDKGLDPGTTLIERPPILQSDRIGRYVILSQLGAGGMGVVYSAFDEALGRRVAIKLLFANQAGSEAARRRLEREAQALAQVSHPNVVQVYEVGQHEGDVFVAMEFVQGVTLKQWVNVQPRRPWPEVLRCYLQAARGLAAAHEAGILHRDFKPDNVIIGDDGRVRVLDFGLARAKDGSDDEGEPVTDPVIDPVINPSTPLSQLRSSFDDRLTATGAVLGTPAYMALEQFLGWPVDVRTDLFSFCVSLYEALYGRRPHESRGISSQLCAVSEGPMAPPPRSGVPARVEKIIMRGLAPRAHDRPASMQELIDALDFDPRRRRRWLAAGGLSLGVAVVAALGGSLASEGTPPCEGLEQRLAGVWDDGQRERVVVAFERSGSPRASTVLPGVVEQLDAQAGALSEEMRAACVATRVTGEQSEERMDRRMACLDDRLRAMRALTRQLAQADARTVANAEQAVWRLPEPGPCADPRVLDSQLPPPRDVAQAQQVERVRERLAGGQALVNAGHARDARPIEAEVQRLTAETGYLPLGIEVDLFRAELSMHQGDHRQARQILLDVVDRAEANRHDEVLAQAWLLLVHLGVDLLGDYEQASGWLRRAETTDLRAGGSARRQVELAGFRAWLAVAQGQAEAAQQAIARGRQLRQALGASSKSVLGLNLDHARGQLALQNGQPEVAVEIWSRTLERLELSDFGGELRLADAHYNLGFALAEAGLAEQAREHYERAASLWSRAPGGPDWRQGLAKMGLGNVTRSLGELPVAKAYLEDAVALMSAGVGPMHPKVGEALSSLGVVAFDEGDVPTAAAYYERALAIFDRAYGDENFLTGIVAVNLGEALLNLGELERAQIMLDRGTVIMEQTLGAEHPGRALALKLLGLTYLLQDRPQEAIAPLSRAQRLCSPNSPLECSDSTVALAVALSYRDPAKARELARRPEVQVRGAVAAQRRRDLTKMLQRYIEPLSELGLDLE
ncbi:MAG: serine/threonine-protein kinase [Myxococcota bacterium]